MAFNLSGGYGAGAGADMLQQILKQKALEFAQAEQIRMEAERLKEGARQADQSTGTARRGQDLSSATASNALGQRKSEFDAMAPTRLANVTHLGASTAALDRAPAEAEKGRSFAAGESEKGRTFTGEQGNLNRSNARTLSSMAGQNALAVANARHPDTAGSAAAQKEQDEVSDSLSLIKELRDDPALSSSVGPLEGRGVGYATAGPEGFTRVKALHDNLINRLSLAQAGKLKGQGPVSNFERDMLSKAATALNMHLGDPDYITQLDKVEAQFKRMQTGGGAPAAPKVLRYDMNGNPIK